MFVPNLLLLLWTVTWPMTISPTLYWITFRFMFVRSWCCSRRSSVTHANNSREKCITLPKYVIYSTILWVGVSIGVASENSWISKGNCKTLQIAGIFMIIPVPLIERIFYIYTVFVQQSKYVADVSRSSEQMRWDWFRNLWKRSTPIVLWLHLSTWWKRIFERE